VENGEIPNDESLVGLMIRNICCANARQYLALPAKAASGKTRKPLGRVKAGKTTGI
jgi:hypothetical protein